MPLTLVTGPANAEKAGFVLGAYRDALDRDPLLVVPTFADVEHYRRELAEAGLVFGASVVSAGRFAAELVRRSGMPGRPLGPLARERLAAAVAARARLRVLAASAATPGFPAALLRLADELAERRIEPPRFAAAMSAWGDAEPARAPYASELGALVVALGRAHEALSRPDPIRHAFAAHDALRLEPARWGATPVLLYGFDDLSALQLDAVETLARHAGVEVTVSLTYEPGRVAFAGRGATHHALAALADRHIALEARAEHYAPGACEALHHLERGLFETDEAGRPGAPVAPGAALRLLEGGGRRAEVELVAAEVARLVGEEGYAPEDVAVVVRDPAPDAALLEQVFAACGLAIALERRVPAGHTALGRGVVTMLRCALLGGSAEDLLSWLRTPGLLERPALADELEGLVRREGAASAAAARALWERRHPTFPLQALDRLAAAGGRGPAALCERLQAEVARLFAAPWRRTAAVLTGPAELDARVAAALRDALTELAALAAVDRRLGPSAAELASLLDGLEVRTGAGGRPGTIAITQPQAIRARRVRALFVCGLQEGAFPAPARGEPFLGDGERRAVNRVAGLGLGLHEDALAVERTFFYAAVSRPTDRLVLSWHAADEAGDPAVASLFVADVRDLFGPELWSGRVQRALGAAGWPAGDAPTDRERRRGAVAARAPAGEAPIAPLRHPEVLAALQGRTAWSASAVEQWASCPVKWFVEQRLDPEALEPDPEALRRGGLAHGVLEDVLRALRERGIPLVEERLPDARRLLHEALARRAEGARLSTNPDRRRSQVRRLEADLLRYVEFAAHDEAAYRPEHFELTFGSERDERGPVRLAGGALELRGRIDRVDVDPAGGGAIVVDYKGRSASPQARWVQDGRLQVGLYVLALEQLLGVRAVGGLYQPLGGDDPRPRGLVLAGADPGRTTVGRDRVDEEAFAAVLAAVEAAAVRAVTELRAGALAPRPESCAWNGGCSYPSICRCEAAG
jgi:ATP-dependent helicase/nuclease subunit B